MREIAPGATVRCVGGMYAGTTGRVESIGSSASGPFASVDVGEARPIAVFLSGLEIVDAPPPGDSLSDNDLRQERDAAIAERDRLRRELETWRDNALNHAATGDLYPCGSVAARLDAILRGES
jgi:hypothetical protein